MRNVSIWVNDAEWHEINTPTCLRLFQYKGVKRTLNEFLSPKYIHRDNGFFQRGKNIPNLGTNFDLAVKGQVVLMGYSGITAAEEGNGQPFMIFPSLEQAVHWLVKHGYDFYGYESANCRRRKTTPMDFDAENMKYHVMAREYEKSLEEPVVVKNNVVVHPATRPNHQGDPVKQKAKKPTFMDNMMKFLRLFKN